MKYSINNTRIIKAGLASSLLLLGCCLTHTNLQAQGDCFVYDPPTENSAQKIDSVQVISGNQNTSSFVCGAPRGFRPLVRDTIRGCGYGADYFLNNEERSEDIVAANLSSEEGQAGESGGAELLEQQTPALKGKWVWTHCGGTFFLTDDGDLLSEVLVEETMQEYECILPSPEEEFKEHLQTNTPTIELQDVQSTPCIGPLIINPVKPEETQTEALKALMQADIR